MKVPFKFFGRIVLVWLACVVALDISLETLIKHGLPSIVVGALVVVLVFFISAGVRHYRRVKLIAGEVSSANLAGQQQRQIELPLSVDESFELVTACLEELPLAEPLRGAKSALQIHACVKRTEPDPGNLPLWHRISRWLGVDRNRVTAVLAPRDGAVSVTLVCEPEGGAWAEWFLFDDGSNLVNANSIARNLTRRMADQRRGEQAANKETATEKELAVARLGLLSAQVEPHFLYNTLGSAKYLIQSDPVKAEAMLDNLISYLRNSLPRTEDAPSTLIEEVTRARAYLDILQIRMGERLRLSIDVPTELERVPFPTMILQTLVENAIKHGLEPKPEGGTVWIRARRDDSLPGGRLVVIVADDGRGLQASKPTAGTGIGLQNVRERLKLLYEGRASFNLTSNFPTGVATTITVPMEGPPPAEPPPGTQTNGATSAGDHRE